MIEPRDITEEIRHLRIVRDLFNRVTQESRTAAIAKFFDAPDVLEIHDLHGRSGITVRIEPTQIRVGFTRRYNTVLEYVIEGVSVYPATREEPEDHSAHEFGRTQDSSTAVRRMFHAYLEEVFVRVQEAREYADLLKEKELAEKA